MAVVFIPILQELSLSISEVVCLLVHIIWFKTLVDMDGVVLCGDLQG